MKNFIKIIMAGFLLVLFSHGAVAKEKLVVYNWFEYIPQALVDRFAAEMGIDVTIDTYDSNEAMLANLKAGSIGTYDVVIPSDYMVKIMIHEGLTDKIGKGELKNIGNIKPEWVKVDFDPGRQYSIPYQWGSTSFAVNRDVYKGDINDLAILFDPPAELAGRINVLDSQNDVLALASLYLGIDQCSKNRRKLRKLDSTVQQAKKHWASFSSEIVKEVLVSGDAAAGMIWNGFSAKARAEGANVEYAYPKQGYIVWMDNVVLLKDAPNRANALKFMDFLLEPKNIAEVSNFAQYAAGIKGAERYFDPVLRTLPEANPPSNAGPGVFVEVCDQKTQAAYDQIWTNLKK